MKSILTALTLALLPAVLLAQPATTNSAVQQIGIYDSRAVAVAFAGSAEHNAAMQKLMAEHDKAKADGNQARAKELEAQGRAQQELFHKQGFSTYPVDNILDQIKDKVEGVKSNAQVAVLISKWDKTALAKYPDAKQVEVTVALVDAIHPSERSRKWAIDIQKQPPVPQEKLEDEGKSGRKDH